MAFTNRSLWLQDGSGHLETHSELALLKELDELVAVSKAVQKYAKQQCDLDAKMIQVMLRLTGTWIQVTGQDIERTSRSRMFDQFFLGDRVSHT